MPIRSFRFSARTQAALGAALLTGVAAAHQPILPTPPSADPADHPPADAPLQDDAVPHGVVPAEPMAPRTPSVAPVPSPQPPAALVEPSIPKHSPPTGSPSPTDHLPSPAPLPLGPPPAAGQPPGPWSGGPHGFGDPNGAPAYGQPMPPYGPPAPSPGLVPVPEWVPVGPQGRPAWTPPADPPVMRTLPSVPFAGANAAVPMRPEAPLAPLPPVGADPTLGPPPGTLGHTYQRPSRLVPWDEHPRVGMIDLTLPPELTVDQGPGKKIRVTVHDVEGQLKPLEGFVGEDKHWHFESEPLIPGLPHIYRVKVERVSYTKQSIRRYGRLVEQEIESGSEVLGVRYLRLIQGRVVTLEL